MHLNRYIDADTEAALQVVSGDGWASDVARPMFAVAESTCTWRDASTGKCSFDLFSEHVAHVSLNRH